MTSTQQWVQAWQHVVTVGRAVNQKIKYFWCMNCPLSPGDATGFYPGDEYVDLVGDDGYSWGAGHPSFDAVRGSTYDAITAINAAADYWIGEMGTDTQANSAGFYTSTYTSQSFPRIKVACWFHKGAFQLTTEAAALQVTQAQLQRAGA